MTAATNETGSERIVRLELMDGEEAQAIVRVIEDANADAEVEEWPGLVVVRAPGSIVLERDRVEAELGRSYNLRDIQGIIAAYYGYWKESTADRWMLEWLES